MNRRLRILVIGPGMEIGGVERSLLGILDTLQWNVDLFLYAHTGEFMPYLSGKTNLLPESRLLALVNEPIASLLRGGHLLVGFLRVISKAYGDARARVKGTESINTTLCRKLLTRLIPRLEGEYDIALGFFAPHYFLLDKVSARIKVGWVHTDYTNTKERPDVSFMLPMWERLDYIACVSQDVKKSFDAVYPSLSHKTLVVENVLSPELVHEQAEEFMPEWPDDEGLRILSVGRFCNAKAFDLIPEVCARSCDLNFRWYLIGYGPDEHLIRDQIKRHGVEGRVIVLGKKTNPYPYMKACDIYAQPSRYEGKAVTVVEAQILNKPVMIARYATSSSQLEEGVDGHICELGVEGIAEGIRFMIEHPEYRKKLILGTKRRDYRNAEGIRRLLDLVAHEG